jgi:hypothetical protein
MAGQRIARADDRALAARRLIRFAAPRDPGRAVPQQNTVGPHANPQDPRQRASVESVFKTLIYMMQAR